MSYSTLEAALHSHVHSYWTGAGPLSHEGGTIAAPAIAVENSDFKPGSDPFITLDVLWREAQLASPKDSGPVVEHAGILQVSMFVPTGWGPALVGRMRDRVEAMWNALSIAGFHPYATSPPSPLPDSVVPSGFFGKRADTSFHWLAESA